MPNSMNEKVSPISSTLIMTVLATWFLAALVLGATGIFLSARPPLPQLIIVVLVVALTKMFGRVATFRLWLLRLDLRLLVALHLTRFVGIYFLVLYGRGELPYAFAVSAGWGDIFVASSAVSMLIALSYSRVSAAPMLLLWNALGMLDITGVVINAARLGIVSPASMGAMLRLPLSLLATFVVPLIVFTHIVIFIRLRKEISQEKLKS